MKTAENNRTENKAKSETTPSVGKNRAKVQEILEKNMKHPTGMFHSKELNERCFLNDLFANFDLTPKK